MTGRPEAETLASKVLLQWSQHFEQPTPEEIAGFDRHVGPEEMWHPAR